MIYTYLQETLRDAVRAILPDADLASVRVQPCPEPKHGDYQTNSLMALARARRLNPRKLASDVAARMDVSAWGEPPVVAGGGFLNFRVKPEAVSKELVGALTGEQLFFQRTAAPRTVVVDFSSPNVAKPMHVGHIRSTILGDSLARALRLRGHRVVTDNHIGDWGTQFGKLLLGWRRGVDDRELADRPLEVMEKLYRTVHQECEADGAVLEAARQELVRLQSGDPGRLEVWQRMIEASRREFDGVYRRLGVRFDHTLGESFYNPRLAGVVDELCAAGLAVESEGARVVYFEDHPELKGHPAMVRKSDGAANYTTTDLATLQYRLETWRPDEVVYVTDGRQQLHFKQLFEIFRRWRPDARMRLAHVWFGSILGEDGKPFRTRSGETVRLEELLDEAEERALGVVTQKNPELPLERRREIARVVGLGAVKYADLLPNRQSDYVFSWDRMLALNGNTAPYIQYAYTRVRSIFRKGGVAAVDLAGSGLQVSAPEECALARQLLDFGFVLEAVLEDYRPNYLCNYLYELAGRFAQFFERCPVLRAAGEERTTRLALCELTARVLAQGLDVLGIEVSDEM
jgi:arginyl-tRNA synthetase